MLTAGGTLAFNTFTTYLQKYLVNTSGFEKTTATEITTLAIFVFMLCNQLWVRSLTKLAASQS